VLFEWATVELVPALLAEVGARALLDGAKGVSKRGPARHKTPPGGGVRVLPKAQVLAETPGRVRVHLAGLRKNPQAAKKVERLLNHMSGVRSVSTNLATGNLLVSYDPARIDSQWICQTLERGNVPGRRSSRKQRENNPQQLVLVAC
jgi:hypothetical protein